MFKRVLSLIVSPLLKLINNHLETIRADIISLKQEILNFENLLNDKNHRITTIEKNLNENNNMILAITKRLNEVNHKAQFCNDKMLLINQRIPIVLTCFSLDLMRHVLGMLSPLQVISHKKVRLGAEYDGGYVMVDSKIDNSIVYNFGVGDNASWDLELVSRGCVIHQYDHTIERTPILNPAIIFHKIGISGINKKDNEMKTIDEVITDNGHHDSDSLIMNMDVEGCEWDILKSVDHKILNKFHQIVIEFHNMFDITDHYRMKDITTVLEKLNITHCPVHVHANNCSRIGIILGLPFPETIEVTYLRRADNLFEISNEIFPTKLDRPNNPETEDYFLGMIGVAWKHPVCDSSSDRVG